DHGRDREVAPALDRQLAQPTRPAPREHDRGEDQTARGRSDHVDGDSCEVGGEGADNQGEERPGEGGAERAERPRGGRRHRPRRGRRARLIGSGRRRIAPRPAVSHGLEGANPPVRQRHRGGAEPRREGRRAQCPAERGRRRRDRGVTHEAERPERRDRRHHEREQRPVDEELRQEDAEDWHRAREEEPRGPALERHRREDEAQAEGGQEVAGGDHVEEEEAGDRLGRGRGRAERRDYDEGRVEDEEEAEEGGATELARAPRDAEEVALDDRPDGAVEPAREGAPAAGPGRRARREAEALGERGEGARVEAPSEGRRQRDAGARAGVAEGGAGGGGQYHGRAAGQRAEEDQDHGTARVEGGGLSVRRAERREGGPAQYRERPSRLGEGLDAPQEVETAEGEG